MDNVARSDNRKNTLYLFIVVLIYKLTLEIGFWYILQNAYKGLNIYKFQFNLWKFLVGLFWIIILFFLINHEERKVSTFFLGLQYMTGIIPITVIFAFSDENVLYYSTICVAFAVAEIIVFISRKIVWPQIELSTHIVLIVFYLITIIVYLGIVKENGMFSLDALNIYNVYEVRAGFKLNKYIGYLFNWQYTIITPFFIIRSFKKKNYISMIGFSLLQLVAYFYIAMKAILFIIPLVILVCILSERKQFYVLSFSTLTLGMIIISIGSVWSDFFNRIFDLLVRRMLFVPANLKFIYYDFFSQNPKIGLAGTLWGKFLGIEHPYKERIGIIISTVYFDKPKMNSNTGFLAEGYYRFGLWGVFLVLILFALILALLDNFAELNGYSFAVSISFFAIFLLNDGGLIDPLLFGPFTILVLLCMFYNCKYDFQKR